MSTGALLSFVILLAVLVAAWLIIRVARRGVRVGMAALLADSPTFAFEVGSDLSPQDATATVLVRLTEDLDEMGYQVETNADASAVVTRSFTPRAAYAIPWGLAVIAFILGVLSDAHNAAQHGGTAAAVLVAIGVLLRLVVKQHDRITFNARSAPNGSRLTVAGSAPTEFQAQLKRAVMGHVGATMDQVQPA